MSEQQKDIATVTEPICWLPTQTVAWLRSYDGPAVATKTAAHRKPIKTDGGVPVYLSTAPATCNDGLQVNAGFDDVAWSQMREQIAALREGHRRKMNDACRRAEMAGAIGNMAEVSINSTESERHREAFVSLNVALGIIDTTEPADFSLSTAALAAARAEGKAEGLEAGMRKAAERIKPLFAIDDLVGWPAIHAAIVASLNSTADAIATARAEGKAEGMRDAAGIVKAASKLLAAFDELQSMTTAQRIITGRPDSQIRKTSNEAIAELRTAILAAIPTPVPEQGEPGI